MKKLLLIICVASSLNTNAQTFWYEDFGTGCNNGTPAIGFTGINGAWFVSATGTNSNYADVWYVSSRANNTGNGFCATGCSNSNNPSLHVGNADLSSLGVGPDSSCTYLTGVFCASLNICSITHRRAESPIIHCSGRFGISVSFLYLENGEGADDDATLWYHDGTTWMFIDSLAKTTVCGSYGIWTLLTMFLPSSADNNPNIKIGFNWTNDNDATGSDPSFAVDNIRLQGSPTSVSGNYPEEEINIFSSGNFIHMESKEKINSVYISDSFGRNISFHRKENTIDMSGNADGIYFIRVDCSGRILMKKIFFSN